MARHDRTRQEPPHTGPGRHNRVEHGFVQPAGIAYGFSASLVEYHTVPHGQAKSEGVLGTPQPLWRQSGGLPWNRRVMPAYIAARLPSTDRLEKKGPPPVSSGKACAFRTVWDPDRLRQEPAGKPHGRRTDTKDSRNLPGRSAFAGQTADTL